MITLSEFRQLIPTNSQAEEWYPIAKKMFAKYDIDTVNRIASFMAQTTHESNDFKNLEENLNYSVANLKKTFARYFKTVNPADYAYKPEKLANYVYMDANRTKQGALGNVKPGDGWKFRGGGIKQLTGRANYAEFGKSVGMTADEVADYVRTKEGAFETACWFWDTRKLYRYADKDDLVGMTKVINGGTNGLADRQARYKRAKTILKSTQAVEKAPAKTTPTKPHSNDAACVPVVESIRRGSKGNTVIAVQKKLGLMADGIFGLKSEIAARSWQRINRYTVDGILTPEQIAKILN